MTMCTKVPLLLLPPSSWPPSSWPPLSWLLFLGLTPPPPSQVSFLKVVEAINECAFKTSDLPVHLSLEMHCSLPQQAISRDLPRDPPRDPP